MQTATLPSHVKGHPRLDRDEERALFARYRANRDTEARRKLVSTHLRDVSFVALKYRSYGVPLDDLVSEGTLGLLRALEKFDPDVGTRFGTYAAYWIRAYIVTYVLRSRSIVSNRSGVLRTRVFFRLRRERARLEGLYGEGGEANRKLAEELAVSEEQLGRMTARADGRDVSLDAAPPGGESTSPTLLRRLSSSGTPEEEYAAAELRHRVRAALETALPTLDARERFIADARILSSHEEELSLAEIGRRLGISRERARQLESRAKKKLGRVFAERHRIEPDWVSPEATAY